MSDSTPKPNTLCTTCGHQKWAHESTSVFCTYPRCYCRVFTPSTSEASPTEPTVTLCKSCMCMTKTIEWMCGKCGAPKSEYADQPRDATKVMPTEPTDELEQLAAWIKRSYQINLELGNTPQGIETDTSFIMQCVAALIRRHDEEREKRLLAAVGPDEREPEYIEDNAHSMKPRVRNGLRDDIRRAIHAEFADTPIKREEG